MTIKEALRSHLLGDASITAMVLGAQIYPVRLPQKVLSSPTDASGAITYQGISSIRFAHLRGQGAAARPRIQLDSWARTFDRAQALGKAIRLRLEGFAGVWSDEASPPIAARVSILFDTEMDLFE